MSYKFWGYENAEIKLSDKYEKINTPGKLYDAFDTIWCAKTCAPRLRDEWSNDNKTLGQCSITSFAIQDILGGRVLGILLEDGNYHCYNEINGIKFDLTSEQFGDKVLNYEDSPEQFKEVHMANEDKRQRYEYLKRELVRKYL